MRRLGAGGTSPESGFTLVELLIVTVIIGLLAAIALPAFVGQREVAEDAEAKSNVGNLMAEVESCYAEKEDYGDCADEERPPLSRSALPLGSATGEAEVVDESTGGSSYLILARSKSGNAFTISKEDGSVRERSCREVGKAGCRSDGSW